MTDQTPNCQALQKVVKEFLDGPDKGSTWTDAKRYFEENARELLDVAPGEHQAPGV